MIRRVASTSISPTLNIYFVVTAQIVSKSIQIPILIKSDNEKESVKTLSLIDSGAGEEFIDQNYTKKSSYKIKKLDKPLQALNVDGTRNKRGTITSFVKLMVKINGRQMDLWLLVTGLGSRKSSSASPGCMNKTQTSTGRQEASLGEKQINHNDSSRSKDAIHASPYY